MRVVVKQMKKLSDSLTEVLPAAEMVALLSRVHTIFSVRMDSRIRETDIQECFLYIIKERIVQAFKLFLLIYQYITYNRQMMVCYYPTSLIICQIYENYQEWQESTGTTPSGPKFT